MDSTVTNALIVAITACALYIASEVEGWLIRRERRRDRRQKIRRVLGA